MSFRGEQVIKGTTYVFEAIAQWDAEKQQSRQKRIYILNSAKNYNEANDFRLNLP